MWQAIIASSVTAVAPPGFLVNITDQTVETIVEGAGATATYTLGTDGVAKNNGATITGQWLSPADATEADLYECQATLVSGTLSAGTTGTWQALTADRNWSVSRPVLGVKECVIDVEIRKIADPAIILGTARITLRAVRD